MLLLHSFKETTDILKEFYQDCYAYWLSQGEKEGIAEGKALNDVGNVKRNPLVPDGDKLDTDAKRDFLKNRH